LDVKTLKFGEMYPLGNPGALLFSGARSLECGPLTDLEAIAFVALVAAMVALALGLLQM